MTKSSPSYSLKFGIPFMLLNTFCLAILDISVKVLRQNMPSGLIVFLSKFGLLLFILPWVLREGFKGLKTEKLHIHLLRSFFGTAGSICFFHGLHYIPMSDAAALENVQYILVVIGGCIFFNEKLNINKILAILLGFIGAVITVNPELGRAALALISGAPISDFSALWAKDYTGHIFIILAISFWSLNTMAVKILGNTERNKTQMFYLLLFASMWSFPSALFEWGKVEIAGFTMPLMPSLLNFSKVNLDLKTVSLLALIGAAYFTHGIAYFSALKSELSVVIPFRYTKLIFSAFLGYLVFGETSELMSYFGYGLIVISSFFSLGDEIKRKKQQKTQKLLAENA